MHGVRLLKCLLWTGVLCSLMKVQDSSGILNVHISGVSKDRSGDSELTELVRVCFNDLELKHMLHSKTYHNESCQRRGSTWIAAETHFRLQSLPGVSDKYWAVQLPFAVVSKLVYDKQKQDNTRDKLLGLMGNQDLKSILGKNDKRLQLCKAESVQRKMSCDECSSYRTADGSCNNLKNPSWGMSRACFRRLLKPAYGDGISELRRAECGGPLPLARHISTKIHRHANRPYRNFTQLLTIFGQFLDHDMTLTPINSKDGDKQRVCCSDDPSHDDPECMPIRIGKCDYFFKQFNTTCLPNFRSEQCLTCKLGCRRQSNMLTAYIDASQVYGVNKEDAKDLRALDGTGRMDAQWNDCAGELLPEVNDPEKDVCSQQDKVFNCFKAGDPRVNLHPGLTCYHTLFLREHNRIARILKKKNPHWGEEKLYQECRRIMGAKMQMITYHDFLPLLIGPKNMKRYKLSVRHSGYTHYNSCIDATLFNSFSSAAFRVGHTLLNTKFPEYPSHHGFRLKNTFFFPFGMYKDQMNSVTLGMTKSYAQKFDRHIIPDVTNHLYKPPKSKSGLDLPALNILRGRDHGVPGYTKFVEYCGGPKITRFRHLDKVFPPGYRQKFQEVYEHCKDIDLFTGGVSEVPCDGAIVGPTFGCIIGMQFHNLKFGDRFYFEHGDQCGSFNKRQLHELRKVTLARMICDHTRAREIQKNVFLNPSHSNPIVKCSELPRMNYRAWEERD